MNDYTSHRPGYRGHVMGDQPISQLTLQPVALGEPVAKLFPDQIHLHLQHLADTWPAGMHIEWLCRGVPTGITGRVHPDEPQSIPGVHLGQPSAHCLSLRGEMVCARWDTALGQMLSHLIWVPARQLRPVVKGRRP